MSTKTIPMTHAEAVTRARAIATLKSKYILGAGGRNPAMQVPFTLRNGKLGSDCIGFVLWCWGLDRYQLDYPFYDGWINTDSLLMDVDTKQTRFAEVDRPYPGCAVVYPSLRKNGKMTRMGHIGLVVEAPDVWPSREEWKKFEPWQRKLWMKKVKVIDCAGALRRKLTGRAVDYRTAEIWAIDGRFVRLKSMLG